MLQDQNPVPDPKESIKTVPVPEPKPVPKPVPVPKIIDLKLPKTPRECVVQILTYGDLELTLPPDQPSVGLELAAGGQLVTLSYINGSGYCGSRVQINPLH